jgi:hypothetical protein
MSDASIRMVPILSVRLGGGEPGDLVRGSSVVAAPGRGSPRKADGPSHRSRATIPVRYTSVDSRTQRHPPVQGGTLRHRDENSPLAKKIQLAGIFAGCGR